MSVYLLDSVREILCNFFSYYIQMSSDELLKFAQIWRWIHTLYTRSSRLFDTDGDGSLSHDEFVQVMKDRLHRGFKVTSFISRLNGFMVMLSIGRKCHKLRFHWALVQHGMGIPYWISVGVII